MRPRYRAIATNPPAPDPVVPQPAVASTAVVGVSKDLDLGLPSEMTLSIEVPKPKDFNIGAKAHKKNHFNHSLFRGLAIAAVIVTAFTFLLGGAGLWANNKYAGRALPFSYIGDMSIGGLTQQEIKQALDLRAKEVQVVLVDGGFVQNVPASAFSAKFDTELASQQAIVSGFKPFAFLGNKHFEVPVKISDHQVDGYLRLKVLPGQTKPQSAKLTIDKNKFVLVPETKGHQTDTKFVTRQITTALATMTDPVINVNAVTAKPKVLAKSLQDDLTKASMLVNNDVSVNVNGTIYKPTLAQKLSWVQFKDALDSDTVDISFAQGLVRQYVLGIVQKYQPKPTDPQSADAPAEPVRVGLAFQNIEETADTLLRGLSTGQPTSAKLIAINNAPTRNPITTVTPTAATTTAKPEPIVATTQP